MTFFLKKIKNSFRDFYKLNISTENSLKNVNMTRVLFKVCQEMKKTIREFTKIQSFSYKYELILQKEVFQNREKNRKLSIERCNILCHLEETIKKLENLRLLKFDVERNLLRVKMDFNNTKQNKKRKELENVFKKVFIFSDVLHHKYILKKRYKYCFIYLFFSSF